MWPARLGDYWGQFGNLVGGKSKPELSCYFWFARWCFDEDDRRHQFGVGEGGRIGIFESRKATIVGMEASREKLSIFWLFSFLSFFLSFLNLFFKNFFFPFFFLEFSFPFLSLLFVSFFLWSVFSTKIKIKKWRSLKRRTQLQNLSWCDLDFKRRKKIEF